MEVDKKEREKGMTYYKSFCPSSDDQEFEYPSLCMYKRFKLSHLTFSRSLTFKRCKLIYSSNKSIQFQLSSSAFISHNLMLFHQPSHLLLRPPLNKILAIRCDDYELRNNVLISVFAQIFFKHHWIHMIKNTNGI